MRRLFTRFAQTLRDLAEGTRLFYEIWRSGLREFGHEILVLPHVLLEFSPAPFFALTMFFTGFGRGLDEV